MAAQSTFLVYGNVCHLARTELIAQLDSPTVCIGVPVHFRNGTGISSGQSRFKVPCPRSDWVGSLELSMIARRLNGLRSRTSPAGCGAGAGVDSIWKQKKLEATQSEMLAVGAARRPSH